LTIYVGGTAWLTMIIRAGQTAVVATPSQTAALSQIPANTAVSIAITAVGTTFHGVDLFGLHLLVMRRQICKINAIAEGSLQTHGR